MIHTNTKHDDFVSGLLLAVLLILAAQIAAPLEAEAAGTTIERLEQAVEEKLGCDVELIELTELPDSAGAEIELVWPTRKEICLPSMLKLRSEGRLVRSLSLRRFVEFELPVVVTSGPVASRTILDATHLSLETRTLAAGSEIMLSLDTALGHESRGRLDSGEPVRGSRLRAAHDIKRGDELMLLIGNSAVSMSATATALGDAYIGQTLSVARLSDGRKYSGVLSRNAAGKLQVVLE